MASYADFRKDGRALTALRAVGLAVEVAFKESSKLGFGMVGEQHVETIVLSGDVQQRSGDTFKQAVRPVPVRLSAEDVALVMSVYHAELKMIEDLGLNVWAVDKKIPSLEASHDLVASFIQKDRPIAGLVSVELKTLKLETGPRVFKKHKDECENRFAQLQGLKSQAAFQALVLLVCRVGRAGGHWGDPIPEAFLFDGTTWSTLQGRPRPQFFRQLRSKKRVASVLNSLEWYRGAGGAPVAKVAQFLKKMKMDTHNVGQRVAIWNRMLKEDGVGLRIQKVRWSSGDPPWCGTRSLFKKILRHCQM